MISASMLVSLSCFTRKHSLRQQKSSNNNKMMKLALVAVFFAAVISAVVTSAASADSKECIAFASITGIAFEPGLTATRVRTANVPRMQCFGNCPSGVLVSAAFCEQRGVGDSGMPSWKCKGTFSRDDGSTSETQYRLGNVRVRCEGCSKSGDPDVVKGSCSLQYSIESRSRQRSHNGGVIVHQSSSYGYGRRHYRDEASAFDVIFVVLFITLLVCCCCAAYRRSQQQRQVRQDDSDCDNKALHERNAGGAGTVHHHHHESPYGGSGFWNGMFLGSMMSGGGWGGGYVSNTTIIDNSGGGSWGSDSGGGGWSDGGGFGGGYSD
jgi:hypothetical protein